MSKRYTAYYDGTMNDETLDPELATATSDGLMSKEDKAKLDSLTSGGDTETGTVIDSIEASKVIEDESHKFVTDEEKEKWNSLPATKEDLDLGNVTNDAQVKRSEMGVAGGVATLDDAGLIPTSQLPGFVDDVVEAASKDAFPAEGESGKLYVDTTENKTYRWSGTQYVEISAGGLALGETSATAYAGDKGKSTTDAVNAIVDGTTVVPAAKDAETVAGHTVEVNVPADAVFTDTVYTHPDTHPATMIEEDEEHRFVTDEQVAKVDAIPEDAVFTDTVYTHPDTHPATMIVEDETHRFATEAQLAKVDAIPEDAVFTDTVYTHPDTHDATMIVETSEKKFATEAQLAKVDAIPEDAKYTDTVYVHPETHDATMIVEDETHRFVTDEQIADWDGKANTTIVTDEIDGLMAADDKVKLDKLVVVPTGPYYDETDKYFYACGKAITVDKSTTEGMITISWFEDGKAKSLEVPEGPYIMGGGNGVDKPLFYPSTCVTVNGGTIHTVYGGNRRAGSVGVATIIINNATFLTGTVGGVCGGGKAYDKTTFDNVVGHAEIVINNTENEAVVVYGGTGNGLAVVGSTRVTMNGGSVQYLTAGGSNGHTGIGEVIVNGGTVGLVQGCNRGSMGNIKITVNDGTIDKLYAGLELGDNTDAAIYSKSEVFVNGGTIGTIGAGLNDGVEDASKVSGTYVPGIISDEDAAAMNLTKAPMTFTDLALEDKTLVLKNGETVVGSVDLSGLTA